MGSQQPPARPWFRLATLARPPPDPTPTPTPAPAPAPAPAPQAQPPAPLARPPFIRPTFTQTFVTPTTQPAVEPRPPPPPPPAPQELAPPPAPQAPAPPTPAAAAAAAALPTPTPVPQPAPSPPRPPATSPLPPQPAPAPPPPAASSPPLAPAPQPAPAPPSPSRPAPPPPPSPPPPTTPTWLVATSPSPKASPPTTTLPYAPASVPPTVEPRASVPSSPLPPSPAPAAPIPVAAPAAAAPMTTTFTARVPSPSPVIKPRVPSPVIKPLSSSPSPLILPPAQLKSDVEHEAKIPPEVEQKTVLVQETIEKPKVLMPRTSNGDLQSQRLVGENFDLNGKRDVTKDNGSHKKLSDTSSEEFGMRVITIAGENKGAIMEFSPASTSRKKQHDFGGNPQIRSGSESSSNEEGKTKIKDNNSPKAMANSLNAYMNSNVQGVNNSILCNFSCTQHDPGVHHSLSRKPNGIHIKDRMDGQHI